MAGDRLLLILGFPAGMGALLRQVAVGAFIAEHTGRRPVVLWRDYCLYWPGHDGVDCPDAFSLYFEPTEPFAPASDASFYPACWSAEALARIRLRDYRFERRPGIDALPEDLAALKRVTADVLVMDHYMGLEKLMPGIDPANPDHGLDYAALLHRHAARLLRPRGEWLDAARCFERERLPGPTLGVHFRGTDKGVENPMPTIGAVVRKTATVAAGIGASRIFLATDCERAADAFRRRFGERLALPEAARGADTRGVHLRPGNAYRKGCEILADMWLLSRCERIILSRASNVAAGVEMLLGDPAVVSPRIIGAPVGLLAHARHLLRRRAFLIMGSLRRAKSAFVKSLAVGHHSQRSRSR